MPKISADLGEEDKVSWVTSTYLLASTAMMTMYGKVRSCRMLVLPLCACVRTCERLRA